MSNYFEEIVKQKNYHQLALAIVFIIYIFFNIQLPHMVAETADSPIGLFVIISVSAVILLTANPIVGILGVVVAYLMIERSRQQMQRKKSISTVMKKEMEKMDTFFDVENQFPKTLEEEIVEKRTLHKSVKDTFPASYKPILNDTVGATTL